MELTATDVQTAVIPGPGTGSPSRRPSELLDVLTEFLAPYHAAAEGERWTDVTTGEHRWLPRGPAIGIGSVGRPLGWRWRPGAGPVWTRGSRARSGADQGQGSVVGPHRCRPLGPRERTLLMDASSPYAESTAPGSVSQAPDLPAGFTTTFTSHLIDANGIRQHVVIGGAGPCAAPGARLAGELVRLAPRDAGARRSEYTVVAVDQRGIGLTDKPADGYDSDDPRQRPGGADGRAGPRPVRGRRPRHRPGDQLRPGRRLPRPRRPRRARRGPRTADARTTRRPCSRPAQVNNKLWHIAFNRAGDIAEQLVAGREAIFFGYEFAIQGGQVPDEAIDYYVGSSPRPARSRAASASTDPGTRPWPRTGSEAPAS